MAATRQNPSYWLENMLGPHRYTVAEAAQVLGGTKPRSPLRPNRLRRACSGIPGQVRPYPGGRPLRIGFREGAIDPLRGTKASVFLPWSSGAIRCGRSSGSDLQQSWLIVPCTHARPDDLERQKQSHRERRLGTKIRRRPAILMAAPQYRQFRRVDNAGRTKCAWRLASKQLRPDRLASELRSACC